jgi:hypothetical protein
MFLRAALLTLTSGMTALVPFFLASNPVFKDFKALAKNN